MAIKGIRRSPLTEFKKGQIPWNKGKKCPHLIGNKNAEGHIPWNKGKPHPIKYWKGKTGSQHPSWKGGKSTLTAMIRRAPQYKKWRADVFCRDGWTCQTCGLRGHGRDIEAHHIISMKEILKKVEIKSVGMDDRYLLAMSLDELFDTGNGITLCKNCHVLTYKKEKL